MYSEDLRWRAIVLLYIYHLNRLEVSTVLGPSQDTISRWYQNFDRTGNVDGIRHQRRRQVPESILHFIDQYAKDHPCFLIEELQDAIRTFDPTFTSTSTSTICRILRLDLNLTRKILTKRVRHARPQEMLLYYKKLQPWYCYPDQLIFMDETSKDGRSALRKYAWSRRGEPAIVILPAGRWQRVSVLASFASNGFIAWEAIEGTYDRKTFHDLFQNVVLPYLNPWPLPRSILIMDNAKIHMYPELEEIVSQAGTNWHWLYGCNSFLFASLLP